MKKEPTLKRLALACALSVCVVTPSFADGTMTPAAVAAPASPLENPKTMITLFGLVLLAFAAANA
jgi:hypothetical protein